MSTIQNTSKLSWLKIQYDSKISVLNWKTIERAMDSANGNEVFGTKMSFVLCKLDVYSISNITTDITSTISC